MWQELIRVHVTKVLTNGLAGHPLIKQGTTLLEVNAKVTLFKQGFPATLAQDRKNFRSLHTRKHSRLRQAFGIGLRIASLTCRAALPGYVSLQTVPLDKLRPTVPAHRKAIKTMISLMNIDLFSDLLMGFPLMCLKVMQVRENLVTVRATKRGLDIGILGALGGRRGSTLLDRWLRSGSRK